MFGAAHFLEAWSELKCSMRCRQCVTSGTCASFPQIYSIDIPDFSDCHPPTKRPKNPEEAFVDSFIFFCTFNTSRSMIFLTGSDSASQTKSRMQSQLRVRLRAICISLVMETLSAYSLMSSLVKLIMGDLMSMRLIIVYNARGWENMFKARKKIVVEGITISGLMSRKCRLQRIIFINYSNLKSSAMKKADPLNGNFRVISDDKRTVKNDYQTRIFNIFYQHSQIAHISIPSTSTVAALMDSVREKLGPKKYPVDKILFLESLTGDEVMDFALQNDKFEISHFKNHENFSLVIQEDVSSESWISLNDFRFRKCLGQGASASVFLVRHRYTGKLYALKQIEKNYFVEFKRMEQVLREKRIMSEIICDFPFVANLYASFESDKHLNFLLEFYPGGEMFFHLQKRRLTENEAKLYFAEMVLTFEFLHERKVIYRDLKPENIMIDFKGHARLTDFGLCKINLTKDDLTTSYCGSIQYMAPEIKQSNGYNYSVDFYTLGAFLYEMVMGVPPYYNNQSLFFNENNTNHYKALVKGLIEEDVANRINNFKMIKNSRWLADINWNQIMKGSYQMPFDVQPYDTYIHEEFRTVSITEFNIVHEQKFDRLFDFFTYVKSDPANCDLLSCYGFANKSTNTHSKHSIVPDGKLHSISMRKKDRKQKDKKQRSSIGNKSNSQSRSKKGSKDKSTSKSKNVHRPSINEQNIYVRKTKEDSHPYRSPSPKKSVNSIMFKKTSTLKNAKSGLDIIKKTMNGTNRF